MSIDAMINKVLILALTGLCAAWIIYYSMQIYKGFTKKEFTIISGMFGPTLSVVGTPAMLWAVIFSVCTIGVLLFLIGLLRILLSFFS